MANIKGHKFKVEIRTTCKFCGKKITEKKFRTFCSAVCRNRFNNRKQYADHGAEKQREYLYKKRLEDGAPRIKCEICGRYYRQVGTHIVQVHKITARQYREEFGFDVKKGQLPEDLRQLKAEQSFEHGGVVNLLKGKKYWFKKGDPKAGKYIRSEQTMQRLKNLHLFKK